MNWDQARKLLQIARARAEGASVERQHAETPRSAEVSPESAARPAEPSRPAEHARNDRASSARAHSLCIASGKGGTGKTVVSASLAALLAKRARTLLVDADLGVGNAHILQNLCPEHSFVDVVEGRLSVRDVRVACRPQLDLIAGGSGVSRMAGLTPYEMHLVAVGIDSVEGEYEHVLVDSAAGISNQTIAFAAASDVVLIVTTPDVTALTDAYAFLKVLLQRKSELVPLFVVNRAADETEAAHVAERLRGVARKFLGREPRYAGWLPDDHAVLECVNARTPVVVRAADSPFAQALAPVFAKVCAELDRVPARGLGRGLLRTVGYTPGLG